MGAEVIGRLAELDQQGHLVGAAGRSTTRRARMIDLCRRSDLGDLLGMDKHAAHLGRLIGAAEPALDPVVGPRTHGLGSGQAAPTDRRSQSGSAGIPGSSVVTTTSPTSPGRDRLAGAGSDELDDDPFVEHHALLDWPSGPRLS